MLRPLAADGTFRDGCLDVRVGGTRARGSLARLASLTVAIAAAGCGGGTHTVISETAGLHTHSKRTYADRETAQTFRRAVRVGGSVDGRAIMAAVVGGRPATTNVLIVGCVHGNEPAGQAVTRYLRHQTPPAHVAWWLVDQFNPDGCTAETRDNAHGVDLNRNSPWHWRHLYAKGSIFWSGPGPLSEPESRAIHNLVLRIRPAVSVWYHQHAALVDSSSGGSRAIESRYARIVGLPLISFGTYPGSITTWQNATFPNTTAFVVELPPGHLSLPAVRRNASAIEAISRMAR